MVLGGYRINLDALLARIVYRWHWQAGFGVALMLAALGLAGGLIPPVWNGRVALTITAPADTHVEVDGRAWPYALYSGDHQITAQHADGRVSWADVPLTAGDTITITLPPGLPEPRERILPPPAPGAAISRIWWADGAWRVLSRPLPPAPAPDTTAQPEPTSIPGAGQTIAVSATGTERLATLDAYDGLADQVHSGSRLVEAVFVPNARAEYGDASSGTVHVRGWGSSTEAITLTAPLTLVRFAPTGKALLLAERVAMGGEQLSLVQPGKARVPVVAVPGEITRLTWHDDGLAVVVHSRQGQRLTLTLVRFAPSVTAAVVADIPVSQYAGDLAPLTWDDTGLLWIAPDQDGPALWRAPLASLLPERVGPFDARALTHLPDGTLRAVVVQDGRVAIGQYQHGLFIGETIVPGVPAAADLAGAWHGDELLLQTGTRAWLLDVSPEPALTAPRR